MIRQLKFLIAGLYIFCAISTLFIGVKTTMAQCSDVENGDLFSCVCSQSPQGEGTPNPGDSTVCNSVTSEDPISGRDGDGIVIQAVYILSIVTGMVSIIIIIISGFMFITANGDSGKVATARNTAIYAVVGIVVTLFAQAIVRFVFNRL